LAAAAKLLARAKQCKLFNATELDGLPTFHASSNIIIMQATDSCCAAIHTCWAAIETAHQTDMDTSKPILLGHSRPCVLHPAPLTVLVLDQVLEVVVHLSTHAQRLAEAGSTAGHTQQQQQQQELSKVAPTHVA
jgi:hypothetical protein